MTACGALRDKSGNFLFEADGTTPRYGDYYGTPSEDDIDVVSQLWNLPGYVLDSRGINRFQYEGTQTKYGGNFLKRCGY